MKYNLIIPEISKGPFSVKVGSGGWIPGHPFHHERDYFIVFEIATMLRKRKIIRRETAKVNKSSVPGKPEISTAEVSGINQVRKWIAQDNKRDERMIFPNRYMKSPKFGWQIPKEDFAFYFSYMTGGEYFDEEAFLDCLLHEKNLDYIEFQEKEIKRKIDMLQEKLKKGMGDTDDLQKRIQYFKAALVVYRMEYLEIARNR